MFFKHELIDVKDRGGGAVNDATGWYIRSHIFRCFGPGERLLQLNGHALLRLGPAPRAVALAIARDSCDSLGLDVTADTEDTDTIEVP